MISEAMEIRLSPDQLILHLIASGVIQLVKQVAHGKPIAPPYPAPLQQGLDRLALLGIQRGYPPVQGLAELLTWCQQPLATWPLDLTDAGVEPGDRLLAGGVPTPICDEWAYASADVYADLEEQHLMRDVLLTCRLAALPATYIAYRQLLIEHPVLTALELHQARASELLAPLAKHLQGAYEEAPASAAVNETFYCCATCGNLLLRTTDEALRCEDPRCQNSGHPTGRALPARTGVYWLKRGLRRFVSAPGRAELRLAQRLRACGLEVALWPAFDAYDLQITFPNQEVWAVDVKDWVNPFLLARQATPIPPDPPWTRAYFVFPDERRKSRPDYLRAFCHYCPLLSLDASIAAEFESGLVTAATRRLKEIAHA